MLTDLIVVDSFYDNPNEVRAFALTCKFDLTGKYPGRRTVNYWSEGAKTVLSNLIKPHGGEVVDWDSGKSSGSFQLCLETDETWIHPDTECTWSAICYLNEAAPTNTGTGFYKHKNTQQKYYVGDFHDGHAEEDWGLTAAVENEFNRLVLFRGALFHKASGYFGNTLETGRLTQTFFFRTQY
jgi:hypothetical protein